MLIPLYLACVTVPAYALGNVQEGISRSYDWIGLSLMPGYIVRQLLLTALMAIAYVAGLPMDAVTAMIVAAVSIWLPTFAQFLVLNRRLAKRIEPGPKAYDFRVWLTTALPILMVEGFYSMLAYTDILVLQQFRPPDEVAVYYAAAKTLALVAFIHYSIAATTAHRFSGYHVAGDRAGLSAFLAQAIKWTFWPSLAATACCCCFGRPILGLFGAQFTEGYHLMFILAAGLLARAAIGPIERLLNMLGEQHTCAMVYAGAFAHQPGALRDPDPAVRHRRRRDRDRDRADRRIHPAVRRHQEPARLPRLRLGPRGAIAPCTARSNPRSASNGGRSPSSPRLRRNGGR